MEPFLQEAPLCFSIMRKSASCDFWIFLYPKIKRLMLEHMDISGKKSPTGAIQLCRDGVQLRWLCERERERAADLRTDLFGCGVREDTDFSH